VETSTKGAEASQPKATPWVIGMTLVILILGRPLERFLHRRFPKLSDHDHEEPPPPR